MRPVLDPKSVVLHPSRQTRPKKGLKGIKIRPVCPPLAPLALVVSPRRPIFGLVDLAKEVLLDLIKARKTHPHPPTPAPDLDTHPLSHPCYTYLHPWKGFIASLPYGNRTWNIRRIHVIRDTWNTRLFYVGFTLKVAF